MGYTNYVMAKAIPQQKSSSNKADVWVSELAEDEQNRSYVTLEINPAYGHVAVIRLSLVELGELADLILERLNDERTIAVPVQVTVPKGALIEVTYLS